MDDKDNELKDPIVAETGETLRGVLVDFDEYNERSIKALLMDFIMKYVDEPVGPDTRYLSGRIEAAMLILKLAEERGYFRGEEE